MHRCSSDLSAPSLLQKADIWSCGVILYTLIYGCYPFNKEEKNYANKIVGAVYRLHPDVPASDGCLNLLRQLLVADPAEVGKKAVSTC